MTEILSQNADGVLAITINRPAKKNALTLAMYTQLGDLLTAAAKDDTVKVVTLCGDNECFSAGNDLGDFVGAGALDENHPVVKFLLTISQFEKPIIAGVAGPAVGIGTTLLFHCDLIYAATNARFQLPFALLGLCPEGASSYLMPKMMGRAKATELLMFGEPVDAHKAENLNLITGVVEEGSVVEYVATRAAQLAGLPYESVLQTKRLMGEAEKINQVLRDEVKAFDRLLNSKATQARLAAMLSR